ncbi:MAG: mechanosensitive ion channel [Flavobacteriales bacterium]|nr:mechanosensitive ion channel [Flavobacteriales bacterium]
MNDTLPITDWTQKAVDLALDYGPKVLLALLVLFIGLRIIRVLVRAVERGMQKRDTEPTLQRFMGSLIGWGLKALLFVSVIQMLGVATTSFVAVLGAAGLAVGLALQGTLANFAGGVLILLFKPYKVGDLIEAQGEFGSVKEIQIFTTVLLTPENKTAIVPNGAMANGNIINYTREGKIRVDLTIGISYDSDIRKAREVLLKVMNDQPNVMPDPAPMVAVSNLNDSSVDLAVRPHCSPEHYWDVYFTTLEQGKLALDAAAVTIPFPQRDVHIFDRSKQA